MFNQFAKHEAAYQNGCATIDCSGGKPPNGSIATAASHAPTNAHPTISATAAGYRSHRSDRPGASNRCSTGTSASLAADPCTANT